MSSYYSSPTTIVPGYVPARLATIVIGIFMLFFWIFNWNLFFPTVITLLVMAGMRPMFTRYVHPFTGQLVVDGLGRENKIRCMFKGLRWIAPGETLGAILDLKTELKEPVPQTWQSTNALMVTQYVYTVKVDASGYNAGEKVVLYASFEPNTIKMNARALISKLFSDYYREKPSSALKNKAQIEEAVFGSGTPGRRQLEKFEADHGCKISCTLEDSDVDKATQAVLDTSAKVEGIADAAKVLVDKGWPPEEARKVVKMLNLPNMRDIFINLDAKGLEELRHFSMLGNLEEDDKGKKGGRK